MTPIQGSAQQRGLSFHDATYFAFAACEGTRLVTLDIVRKIAAKAEGVELI